MWEELAIATLGYVVLDKIGKDCDQALQDHRRNQERWRNHKLREDARLAAKRDLEQLLTPR